MTSPVVDFSERRGMDKQKALESALAQIERSFGKGKGFAGNAKGR